MGWSCSAKASLVMSAISTLVGEKSSNALPGGGGFYEASRKEHNDGAITGSVWKHISETHCRKAGSFKISGDGKIERFPYLPKAIKAAAEASGAAEYTRIHGA